MRTRIRLVRKNAGLTQQEFSVQLGYAPTSAASWEKTDAQEPPEPVKLLICKTFHVREEWLRTGEGEMYEQDAHAILDQLAKEYNLGPAGRMIIQAALKMYDIGGEKAFVDLVRDILPIMQDIVKQADSDMLSHALAAQEAEQAQSGTK